MPRPRRFCQAERVVGVVELILGGFLGVVGLSENRKEDVPHDPVPNYNLLLRPTVFKLHAHGGHDAGTYRSEMLQPQNHVL